MAAAVISAEITAVPEKQDQAARRLRELGFRVRGLGTTISVEAPKRVWERVFRVSFRQRSRQALRDVPESSVRVWEPTRSPSVPKQLEGLVIEVAFVPPPELF